MLPAGSWPGAGEVGFRRDRGRETGAGCAPSMPARRRPGPARCARRPCAGVTHRRLLPQAVCEPLPYVAGARCRGLVSRDAGASLRRETAWRGLAARSYSTHVVRRPAARHRADAVALDVAAPLCSRHYRALPGERCRTTRAETSLSCTRLSGAGAVLTSFLSWPSRSDRDLLAPIRRPHTGLRCAARGSLRPDARSSERSGSGGAWL